MSLDELRPNDTALKLLTKESRVYKRLLLTRLGGINYAWRGVRFERVDLTQKALFFRIATQRKSILYPLTGMVWNALPSGVYLSDLLDDKVLTELSFTCQHKATGHWDSSGAWYTVHRIYESSYEKHP